MLLPAIAYLIVSHGPGLTGQQILARCQKAYDSVQTFEQDVRADMTGQAGTKPASAHISFNRPNQLRVSGNTMFGSTYDMVSDGKATWVQNIGSWSKSSNVGMGIAAITGISANAATAVPSIFFHCDWNFIKAAAHAPVTSSSAKLGGQDAYLVKISATIPMSIWIDKKTFFLLKTEASVMSRTIVVEFSPPKVNRPIPPNRFKKP
jgi:outer membrane lipoprotein-sorting protein